MSKQDFKQRKALPKLTLGAYHYILERTITQVGAYRSGVARCDWVRNLPSPCAQVLQPPLNRKRTRL